MGVNLLEMTRLGGIDPSTVTVYRQGDLERANRDLEEAEEIAYGLTIYLDGIFTGRRNLGMRAGLKEAAVKERERLFQQLYERRLFREVWDRKHMGHTQPQSPPGSPAIAPDS